MKHNITLAHMTPTQRAIYLSLATERKPSLRRQRPDCMGLIGCALGAIFGAIFWFILAYCAGLV